VPRDYFSARWTQPLPFQGGTYRFTTTTDDGVRLWVDGRLLIDSWRPMRGTRHATIRLSPGIHDVKVEYYERTGVALARLTWRRLSR
jgi:mannan endo-1,4-beta-mannosidase